MEHLHRALASKKIRQPEREWMLHILICPFGSLSKNIMPVPGTTRGMEKQGKRWRKRKEFGDAGIEIVKWEGRLIEKDKIPHFLTLSSQFDGWPIKEASGD